MPILAHGRVVGTIVFSYGALSTQPQRLPAIAAQYHVSIEALARCAAVEKDAGTPDSVMRAAKRHVETIALLLGEMVERRSQEYERERLRELFVGMLGHDLRGPLTAILMAGAQLVHKGEPGVDLANRIVRSGERMRRMIEELLDFTHSRLGGGIPIHPSLIDLHALVEETVDEMRSAHPDATVEFFHHGVYMVICDPSRMAQVLDNLLGNALAHGAPGTPVEERIERDNNQAVIRVHNEGLPIPADLLAKIFDPFEHRETVRDPNGLGLGLYIAHEIVDRHHGTIEVSSSAGCGTTFVVRIPER